LEKPKNIVLKEIKVIKIQIDFCADWKVKKSETKKKLLKRKNKIDSE
jgi:hypothetical protein